MYLSVYSALEIQNASLDGRPLAMERQEERSRPVYTALIELPPGANMSLDLRLVGAITPGADYRLGYAPSLLSTPIRSRSA